MVFWVEALLGGGDAFREWCEGLQIVDRGAFGSNFVASDGFASRAGQLGGFPASLGGGFSLRALGVARHGGALAATLWRLDACCAPR